MIDYQNDLLSVPFSDLDRLRKGAHTRVPAKGGLPALYHAWDSREVDALQVALLTRRPLLLRGEPGCGKTQLARAAAHELRWKLRPMTVHPRMEPNEVLYRFDAVERLAWAQDKEKHADLHSNRFYEPGPLWWALHWESARQAYLDRNRDACSTQTGEGLGSPPVGHVVLIDEIDKADTDLPNSLLEVFGERELSLPCPPYKLSYHTSDQLPPLILVTTNEDRELPAPFLRRCVVLQMDVQADDADWLFEHRAKAHYRLPNEPEDERDCLDEPLMREAANLLVEERALFFKHGLTRPGVAEYLDLLQALHAMKCQHNWTDEQLIGRLRQFSDYLYRKHGGEHVPVEAQQCRVRND